MTPSVISHYRLLDTLGEGGMGIVYRAEDLHFGREVAVKVLRSDAVASAEWLARFEREARLASSLQHPHIATIHELGEHDGQPFIVMERLEGSTIRKLIESGALPPDRVLEFARQIGEALDAAHRRGIVHRDIKPANLFVTYGDHVKVLDFGLAKMASEEAPTATAGLGASTPTIGTVAPDLTRTGLAVGTAAYMSPEQALGQAVDARTDLFSLGTVLYELATGRRAFGGDDMALIVTKIVNGIVVAPRAVNPAIPENLEAIIQKLMAVDPQQRYQAAAELLADVRAAVQQNDPRAGATSDPALAVPATRSRRLRRAVTVGLAFVLVIGVGRYVSPSRGPALTDRDSLLIGTFDNTTSDPVFDETLATALKVQLGQSPFLDIVSDQRIRDTLRLMEREADESLTHAVAREACQRMGVKAMLEGSIAMLGSNYVLTLNATDCGTGETLATDQTEATSKESVLQALGSISSSMRTKLGESLPSLQSFDVPIEQATTRSLAALKAYALGLEERRRGRELESVAFFNQAIEHDRDFASAYVTLSTVYGSLGEWRRSEEYARLAYQLQKRVSERERLYINYQFDDRVTGNEERAAATLEVWKIAYPRDSRPVNALALIHNRMGRYDRAEAEAREALRRTPGHPFPMSNLAFALRSMGRYDEARKVGEEAMALGVETTPTRRLLYQLGVLAADGSADAHIAWSKDRPREFDLVSAQAQVAAYEGRLGHAEEMYRRAADMAAARGLRGTASGYMAHLAWTQVLYRAPADETANLRRILSAVVTDADAPGTLPRFRAGAAYGLAGMSAEAQAAIAGAVQRYPESTFVRTVLVPSTTASTALRQGRPADALRALQASAPTELGTVAGLVTIFLRGQALLHLRSTDAAIHEFDKLLTHRGVDPFAPMIPLAHLGIARARAIAGDLQGSRRAYEELFAIWKNADPDFPPLAVARAEYARLAGT
jgi:eukaryotic-like serine/threonine-protein kinase